MNTVVSHGLPPRLGHSQHEGFLKHAARCSVFHVHPGNRDKIPCFVSGYRVCLLAGHEDAGIVFLRPERDQMRLQLTEAASGVSSMRPCFVPIEGMHRSITTDARGCVAPHLIRVRVLGVVDEYGVVQGRSLNRDGFPQSEQGAFLFPHGVRHRVTEREGPHSLERGLVMSGLYGGRTAILEPMTRQSADLRGVPVICPRTGEPVATTWV